MNKIAKILLFLLLMSYLIISVEAQSVCGINPDFVSKISEQEAASKGEFYRITLMTVSPGYRLSQLYVWWGHSAIIVEDTSKPENSRDRASLYDYGIFSIPEKNLLLNFIRGRIDYSVAASPGVYKQLVINNFIYENRWVVEQPLNLEPAAAYKIAMYLKMNTEPGNDSYLYHFFFENCCTKLRDIIDYGIGGELKKNTSVAIEKDLRDLARQYVAKSFLADWGLMFVLGERVADQEITAWDSMFLPYELMVQLQNFEYHDSLGRKRAIVKKSEVIEHLPPSINIEMKEQGKNSIFSSKPDRIQEKRPLTWLLGLFFGIVVGSIGAILFLFGTKNRGIRIVGGIYLSVIVLLLFVIGTILFILVFFSGHDVTKANWNLLLINPFTMFLAFVLSLLYAADVGKSKIFYGWFWIIMAVVSGLMVFAKVSGLYVQDNLMVLSALLPLFLFMAITAVFRNRLKSKKEE